MQDARGSKVVGGGAAQTKAEQKQNKSRGNGLLLLFLFDA